MHITTVKIKNFRSILNETFALDNLNVLVGLNDSGKSNFLKALNLFFNQKTEPNSAFNFERDYCSFAIAPPKKAPEIIIELVFDPPENYSIKGPLKWIKRWRRDGLQSNEEITHGLNSQEVPKKSKARHWLTHLSYKYVPAIKGEDYFASLLRDLHDVFEETIESDLKTAGANFINAIKDNSQNMSSELKSKLGFESHIELPSDLRNLFSTLDFKTEHFGKIISLQNRGDGIKSRHIPIILKFLADQQNRNRQKGSPRINTIWGYEEPENNLELGKSFELKSNFLEYGKDIQLILTTHSPAFYSATSTPKVSVSHFFIHKDDTTNTSKINNHGGHQDLDAKMGLLPLITPHIEKIQNDLSSLQESHKLSVAALNKAETEIKLLSTSTLFVEGLIDKEIIERYQSLSGKSVNEIQIQSEPSAGANWVADRIIAWAHTHKEIKCAGLFDKDNKGKEQKKRTNDIEKCRESRLVKSFTIEAPEHLQGIFKKNLIIPVTIEEIYSIDIWKYAQSQNWLEIRNDIEKIVIDELASKNNFKPFTMSFADWCKSEKKLTDDELLYLLHRVKQDCKKKLKKYILNLPEENVKTALAGLARTMDTINAHFGSKQL